METVGRQCIITHPMKLITKVEGARLYCINNVLGNVEASEESSYVLVRGLPWQPSGSDHCVVAHFLHLTAAQTQTQIITAGVDSELISEEKEKKNNNNVYLDQMLLTKCQSQTSH